MPLIDGSGDPRVPLPLGPPPPLAILPHVEGAISQAVKELRDGRSGFVLVHEKTQDGSINATNAVFVKRFGENVTVTGWVGHDWGKPGTVSYGGSLTWEFD